MITQADKDALVAKVETARAGAVSVAGLTAAERDPLVSDLVDAKAKALALEVPPVGPPPTTNPNALPINPRATWVTVMPSGAFLQPKLTTWLGPSAAAYIVSKLQAPAATAALCGDQLYGHAWPNSKFTNETLFWQFVRDAGLEQLGATPPPGPTYPAASTFTGLSLASATATGPGAYDVVKPLDPSGRWASGLDFIIPTGCLGLSFSFRPVNTLIPSPPPNTDTLAVAGHYRVDDGAWVRIDGPNLVVNNCPGQKLQVIGGYPPYTHVQYVADVATWRLSPLCKEVVEFTSFEGRPFYRMTFTAPSGSATKGFVMHRSQHPVEQPADWSIQGMTAWLLGGSPEAAALLAAFEVHIYAMTNPDGNVHLWYRDTDEVEGNRWAVSGPGTFSDGLEQRQIRLDLHNLMTSGKPVRAFMDWHNSGGFEDFLHFHPSIVFNPNITTYDPSGRINPVPTPDPAWISPDGENISSGFRGESVRFPHRDVAIRYGICGILKEYGYNRHKNGVRTTIASAQAVGVSLLRATAAWVATH